MKDVHFTRIATLDEENPRLFGMLTTHIFQHLMHAMEVIAYKHPDPTVSAIADEAYSDLARTMHLNRESGEEMKTRLMDELE